GRRDPGVRSGVEVGDIRRGVGVRRVRLALQRIVKVVSELIYDIELNLEGLGDVAPRRLSISCDFNVLGGQLHDPGLAVDAIDSAPAAARRSPEPGASRRDKLLPGFSHDYSSAPALLLADGRGRRPAVF